MVSILINEDILLRTYVPDDSLSLFEAINRNRAHLRPWLLWVDATTKQEHSLHFIEHSLIQLNNQEGIALGIFHNREVIGGVGMIEWNHRLKKAQVGYWIDKRYEGKGILSLCIERFLDFLFTKLDLNKIEIQFVVSNKRSAAIAEKLNARIEGVLRDSYIVNGRYEDLVVTGILKKDWKPSPVI